MSMSYSEQARHNVWSIQQIIDRFCEIINRYDPETRVQLKRDLQIQFPRVIWTIHEKTGKLSGDLV